MKNENNKGKRKRHIHTAAGLFAVIAVAGGAMFYKVNAKQNTDTDTEYREYRVSKGNITIGTNESGTVAIERKYVSYPCSAEVSEVYVKNGTTVEEGDALLKLSLSDIEDTKEEYEERIASAELALSEAKVSYKTKSAQAQQTYESAVEKGKNAAAEYGSYVEKSEAGRLSEQDDLQDMKDEREEYTALSGTYDEDYARLEAAGDRLDGLKDEYKAMEKQYKEYQRTDDANSDKVDSAKKEYEDYLESIADKEADLTERRENYDKTKAAYEQAQEDYAQAQEDYETALSEKNASSSSSAYIQTSSSDSDNSGTQSATSTQSTSSSQSNSVSTAYKKMTAAGKALEQASSDYNLAKMYYTSYQQEQEQKIADKKEEYEDRIEALEDEKTAHEKITKAYKAEMEDLSETVSEAEEEYNDIKADFTDRYGTDDADSLRKKLEQIDEDIAAAELNIRTSAADNASSDLNARQQADQAAADASNAKAVYDQTMASLESEVESKQKAYDDAVEEYEEFCESVESGGIVYAPCAGIVSSVGVVSGDKVQADMNIVTLMDRRYIYLSTNVSEEDITSLYSGQECSVSLTAYEGRTFEAHIDAISAEPARSSGSVSYTVTVKLDDESGLNVLEGMSGEIDFIEKQASDVLYVNVNAVTFRDGASYVKVYDENGNVVEKEVVTGFTDGRSVEIKSGVSANDTVLAEIELSSKSTDKKGA